MDRSQIQALLDAARQAIHHSEYVIIGSLSVLGAIENPPARMTYSIDVDLWPRNDPGRAEELFHPLGQGSLFEAAHGYYADPASPALPALPEGWEARLVKLEFPSGVIGWFLEPHDAAVSKYARLEDRDREWIRAGLESGILSPSTIATRIDSAPYLDQAEHEKARAAFEEDRAWLASRQS